MVSYANVQVNLWMKMLVIQGHAQRWDENIAGNDLTLSDGYCAFCSVGVDLLLM